jgi:hypothetical protein
MKEKDDQTIVVLVNAFLMHTSTIIWTSTEESTDSHVHNNGNSETMKVEFVQSFIQILGCVLR